MNYCYSFPFFNSASRSIQNWSMSYFEKYKINVSFIKSTSTRKLCYIAKIKEIMSKIRTHYQNFGPFLLLCADSVAFQINNASMFHDNINLRTWWEKSSFLRLEAECMRWDFLLIKLQEKWAEDINIDFNYDLLQILTFYTSPARRNTSSCKINPLLSHF